MACNPDRFVERVMSWENGDKAFCRCCGRRIAVPAGFWSFPDPNYLDGYCRRCELDHPKPFKVERPRLFA